ncbi:MAG TPA: hypothetical protein VLC98_06705 [Phnomibacter sp.]|nr:hypothetical protein [Phnomibacter sp.]
MKRLASISLLFIFLCANTAFGQLLKLPALVQHYFIHHDAPTNHNHHHHISFWDFLKEHYGQNNAATANTKHGHENLPFKGIDTHAISTIVLIPQFEEFSAMVPVTALSAKKIPCIPQPCSSTHLSSIWQPPRFS